MRKTNVLHVIGGLDAGGAETFLVNLLTASDNQKYKYFYLCNGNKKFDYEQIIVDNGGTIIRERPPKKIFDIFLIKRYRKIIIQNEIDIVHCHTCHSSIYPVLAAKKTKVKKIIVHAHTSNAENTNSIIKKIYKIIATNILSKQKIVRIACGDKAGKELFKNDDFIIIRNGINTSKYSFNASERERLRKKYKIKNNQIVIGHVGRFNEVKNHKFIINLFEKIHQNNKNYVLLLIGDGPLFSSIKNDIHTKKLDQSVILTGKISDTHKYYSLMDIFIFPSKFEGLPLALIEAQANGLNIIASSNIDNDVKKTENVKFLDLNIDSWKKEIEKTIVKRRTNSQLSEFDIKHISKKIEELYA